MVLYGLWPGSCTQALTSPSTMPSTEWGGVKSTAAGLWRSGTMVCQVASHAVFGTVIKERIWWMPGKGYLPDCIVLAVQIGGGRSNIMGLLCRGWTESLSSSEGNFYCFSLPRHFGQFYVSNFVGTFWCWSLSLPAWLGSSAQSNVHTGKVGYSKYDVEDLEWPVQSQPQHQWTPLGWSRTSQALLQTLFWMNGQKFPQTQCKVLQRVFSRRVDAGPIPY